MLTGVVKIYNEYSNEESLDASVREEMGILKRVNDNCLTCVKF